MPILKRSLTILFILAVSLRVSAQKSATKPLSGSPVMFDSVFTGIKFRNIGPGFMSGRIADVAIHPVNENTFYVAVASGGVWKTVNEGTTWTPVFDEQKSYSIGCVTVDSKNPHI